MGKPKNKRPKIDKKKKRNRLELKEGVPRSIVAHRGRVGWSLRALKMDLRNVMQPHTAVRLRERSTNTLKDYVSVSAQFDIRNVLMMTATERASYLRVIRVPHGPTLTFRLENYSLMRDLARVMKRPVVAETEYMTPPLVVLNGFDSSRPEHTLAATMFKGLFPAINVHTTKLKECRRVLLIECDAERDTFLVRHYLIVMRPVGISRAVKKTVLKKSIPVLSSLQDVSEYVLSGGLTGEASDSEGDDMVQERVSLPERYRNLPKAKGSQQSAVRMREIGPRMELKLIKIVEGISDGDVVYHALVKKTPAEVAAMRKKRLDKASLKATRRAMQEQNVRRKKREKGEEVTDSEEEGAEEGEEEDQKEDDEEQHFERAFAEKGHDTDEEGVVDDSEEEVEQDDAYWYRTQVGEEPGQDFHGQTEMPKKKAKKASWFEERKNKKKRDKESKK